MAKLELNLCTKIYSLASSNSKFIRDGISCISHLYSVTLDLTRFLKKPALVALGTNKAKGFKRSFSARFISNRKQAGNVKLAL